MNLQAEFDRIKSEHSPDEQVIVLGQDYMPALQEIDGVEFVRGGLIGQDWPNAIVSFVWNGFLGLSEFDTPDDACSTRVAVRPGKVYLAESRAIDKFQEAIADANEEYHRESEVRMREHHNLLEKMAQENAEKIERTMRGEA